MTGSEDPNLLECPRCGARITLAWSRCPECGLSLYPDEDMEANGVRKSPGRGLTSLGWWARSLVTFMLIGGLLGALTGLTLGFSWIAMMLAGILLFCLAWTAWDWLRRRKNRR